MILSFETKVEGTKPCPFCGGETIKTDSKEWVAKNHVRGVRISCDECGSNVFSFSDTDDYHTSFLKAMEKWNRRTP